MKFINLNEIVLKHWIKFNYDVSNALTYIPPHHVFKIEDSIHFKTLKSGDFTDYNNLITTTNQEEHSEKIFRELIENFDTKQLKNSKIKIFYDNSINKYIVEDGCHRLAILKYNKINKVPVEWLKIS
tara:strand:- start:95 stop:475 length:381 start_codon:yes stop_codon:yes gene_type:complete